MTELILLIIAFGPQAVIACVIIAALVLAFMHLSVFIADHLIKGLGNHMMSDSEMAHRAEVVARWNRVN